MLVRYIITRPVMPKRPRETKTGISHAKAQDTTALAYKRTCEELGEEPNAETYEHLSQRDRGAWAVSMDIFSGRDRQIAAINDAVSTTAAMRAVGKESQGLPARNPWSCDRCDWASHCSGDPVGDSIHQWMGAVAGKPASPIRVSMPNSPQMRKLARTKPGHVVSPSELRSFMTCPRKWALEYVERMRPRDRQWARMGPRVRGVITHAFFEAMLIRWQELGQEFVPSWQWSGSKWGSPEDHLEAGAKNLADSYLDDIKSTVDRCIGDLDPNDHEGLRELIACIPACAKAAHDAAGLATTGIDEIIGIEKTKAIKLPGVSRWVFGIADAIAKKGDQTILIELKTTSTAQLDSMAERYRNNVAVDLYAAMIEHGREARRG